MPKFKGNRFKSLNDEQTCFLHISIDVSMYGTWNKFIYEKRIFFACQPKLDIKCFAVVLIGLGFRDGILSVHKAVHIDAANAWILPTDDMCKHICRYNVSAVSKQYPQYLGKHNPHSCVHTEKTFLRF